MRDMIERIVNSIITFECSREGVYHRVYAYESLMVVCHGMEPDTASPESQPLFSIMAWKH